MCGNAACVVTGVIGLQAAPKMARQANRGVGFFDHRHFFGPVDQIAIGTDLGHCSHHLRGQPFAQLFQVFETGIIPEHMFTQFANRPVLNAPISGFIDTVLNQTSHAIVLVGDHRVVAQVTQKHLGEHLFGGHPFACIVGSQTR